jgi:hypothetical protein
MPFSATVLPVMIASPGDVNEYRGYARDILHEWNYIHSIANGVVLMPFGWETHASPELGATPQDLINDRILEDCDLLFGIFWTRLGTPTGKASSGTVEEIQRHVQAGKPAMVYFCEAPVSLQTVDPAQYNALQEFRKWCMTQGLIESFLNATEFQLKVRRHLQIVIQKNEYLRTLLSEASKGANPAAGKAIVPTDELSAVALTLSPEAKELILAAASESTGVILAVDVLAGRMIQAGSRQFGEMEDRRSMAKWDYGLQQLLTLGLIERFRDGGKGDKLFQIIERGYQVADRLKPVQQ